MHKIAVTTTVAVAFLTGALTSIPLVAVGSPQVQVSALMGRILEHISWQQRDIRDGLRELFRESNVSYAIAPEVQGEVTVDLRNVTMEVALQNVLRQVDATYRIENGVVMILRRPTVDQAPAIEVSSPDPRPYWYAPPELRTPTPTTMEQDGRYLYILRGKTLLKVAKKDLKIERSVALPLN